MLGPLLFALYINGLGVLDDSLSFLVRYADDQTLCSKFEKAAIAICHVPFDREIENVYLRCNMKEMFLNLKNTPTVTVHDIEIGRVPSAPLLGTSID